MAPKRVAPVNNDNSHNDGSSSSQSQDLVQAFSALFRGRTDAWGSLPPNCNHEPVTLSHYERLLKGYNYLVRTDQRVLTFLYISVYNYVWPLSYRNAYVAAASGILDSRSCQRLAPSAAVLIGIYREARNEARKGGSHENHSSLLQSKHRQSGKRGE